MFPKSFTIVALNCLGIWAAPAKESVCCTYVNNYQIAATHSPEDPCFTTCIDTVSACRNKEHQSTTAWNCCINNDEVFNNWGCPASVRNQDTVVAKAFFTFDNAEQSTEILKIDAAYDDILADTFGAVIMI
eukprot:Awhi_evm2s13015